MDNQTIKQLIQNYKASQLQELVLTIVDGNPTAQQALLDYCQKKGKASNPSEHAVIIENQLKHHWSNASEIIEEFDRYGGGPEEEEETAYDELEKMLEILEFEEAPWEPRKEILEEVLGFVMSDNSGFGDMLMDVADALCRTKEERIYLADQLAQNGSSYDGNITAAYVSMGKEANYARAVGVLKEIRQIMKSNKWAEEWETRYQAFLVEHRRKKLLLKQLENFRA